MIYNMGHLSIAILLLCLALNAVSLFLFHLVLRNMTRDIAFLKTWLRRTYLQSSYLYQASLIKVREMAIESEDYEMVKRLNEMIKVAQEDMEKLFK